MSDHNKIEILKDEAPPQKTKKRWIVFLLIFLLIFALLCWFLLSNSTSLDGVKRFFRYLGKDSAQYGRLQFETYGTSSYALVDDRFAVGTQSGAMLFAEDGSILGRVQGGFSAPALKSAGTYLLVYDIGGTHVALLNRDGDTCFDLTAGGTIFDADVSPAGYVALLYEGKESRATLEVYEKEGALLYRRNSKTTYLNACAVSPDGATAAAATLGQADVSFAGGIQFLRTDQEETAAEQSAGAQILYDMAFLNEDTLCAVGDHSLLFYQPDGVLRGEFMMTDAELTGYSFGDGYVALLSDPYETGSACRLTTLDTDGTVLASAEVEGVPLDLSACGSYVAVLTEQTLFLYNRSLSPRGSTENKGSLAVLVRSDGTAFCISAGEAELYIP